MKTRFYMIVAAALAVLAGTARAQVEASLVSSVTQAQAGTPFTVAIRLVHRESWHTYWLNPGTGLATSVKWTLPAGWKAGDIEWPAPRVLKDREGNITGNGYEGDLLLPVTLTPPAGATGAATLGAAVDWLMCQNVCEPGNATLSLKVDVGLAAPIADATWGPKIQAAVDRLPKADPAWPASATREGKEVTLQVRRGSGAAAEPEPGSLHFFSDDNFIGYELPQKIESDGHGGYVLHLSISPDGPQDAKVLHGVLTAAGGFGPDEPGLRIDAPFGAVPADTAYASAGPAETPGARPAAGPSSLPGTLFLAFFGGLILNLMPCVFPVLGIKVLGFVRQAGSDRGKVVAHALTFSAGVLLSFWALAGVLVALRHGGSQLGWGFQLQSPGFILGLSVVMLVFALNLSGVFEFGLRATAIGGSLQTREGYTGSFFTGVLATLVATPCSAPMLAPALGAALALSAAASFLVFTVIALGLCTPYLLLSAFPSAVKILPRPGAWMETFKQLMAFPLYGTVGYLLWVLAGQVPEAQFLDIVLGLTVIALAVWVYGRFHSAAGVVAALVIGVAGLWNAWPRPAPPDAIVWQKWSPQDVAKLHSEGRIVYVDFTARWCATCQANKRVVFHSGDVLRVFRDKHIATLRGDWTNQDPAITAELARYHRSAVPFNEVWLPGQDRPVILSEILTPKAVLDVVGG